MGLVGCPFHKNEATKVEKWLTRIRRGKPLAVILESGANGLSFSRSLGRRGVPTLLLDLCSYQ